MSKLPSQALLIGLVTLMITLFVMTKGDPNQETYLLAGTFGLLALSLVLERLRPLHRKWNHSDGDMAGDVGSLILIFGALDSALKWGAPFLVLWFVPEFAPALEWPLWTQIIIATLLIELGAWVSHWLHHTRPSLWAMHAMHHQPERLYTLNNFRFHPLNHIVNYGFAFLPLMLLGISKDALLFYAAASLPILLLQHSNVGFDFGGLNNLFNTNAVHRWHHSAAKQEGLCNFGRALVIFDQAFGTFYNPAGTQQPKKIGLFGTMRSYPAANRIIAQLLWPFHKDCCRN